MIDPAPSADARLGWRFPATFWFANVAELFERAAFYGMFITLRDYLGQNIGFGDVYAGVVAGGFSLLLYTLPAFLGPLADKLGFRAALMLAFALLTAGYALLGAFTLKSTAIMSLLLIVGGGAIVKPVISGTASKCSDAVNRARAFSIFYLMVNIGAFSGKTFAPFIRQGLGMRYINFYAAALAFAGLLLVALAYRNPDSQGMGKSFGDVARAFGKVICNWRFMALIVIVSGFWTIQGQLYAAMPAYIFRLRGADARPEWLANINPLIVMTCVVWVTHLVRNFRPENSIAIALFIIPFSALAPTFAPALERAYGQSISILGLFSLHPITLMVIVGIAFQGFGECFLSPKFMEYASKQAPPGEEGLYMGFQHLHSSIAWLVAFVLSGHLLDRYCPDPLKLQKSAPEVYRQWEAAIAGTAPFPDAYASAHYLWYVYAAIGVGAFFALLVFKYITMRIDRRSARLAAAIPGSPVG
ncbi:MAG TPA: MFS transporter [Phycisphaerae bacterium]|nr:MFS transporter [Phycisphaerae bacterium]